MIYRTGIGQDSHGFLNGKTSKKCIIAGIPFHEEPGLDADSDGDVVFHAICNAITSLTHVPILGGVATDLYKHGGITDSRIYLEKALETLGSQRVQHVALSIEGKRPRFQAKILEMRKSVAKVMRLDLIQVGFTVTSGDGLTSFGTGEGLMCWCLINTYEKTPSQP